MRLLPVPIFLAACWLYGCSNPYEPHPKEITRYPHSSYSSLSTFLAQEYGYYDAEFESSVFHHYDSTDTRFENTAVIINRLGHPYIPPNPFSVLLNGSMLLDTAQYSLSYASVDSLDFSHPLVWQVNGGKTLPFFSDTLVPPQKAKMIFPNPDISNNLPKKPFTITYMVLGVDSVYVQFFNLDTLTNHVSSNTFHAANTGTFDISQDLIKAFQPNSELFISIAAISSHTLKISDNIYLVRAGVVDHAYVHLSN